MKSPLLLGSDAPHVHPRQRKRLSRCTLDCGFKTSESPALRGFVAERCPITGTSLYLVLKSNGLCHSKNPPVKFSFSLKIVPATIVQKLSAHSLLKSVFFRISTSLTNAPRSLSQAKVGTHLPLLKGSHTRAHTPKQVVFWVGVVSLPSERSARFGNPAWPGSRTANFAAFGSQSDALLKNVESLRDSDALMRVAVPKASRPRWAAQLYLFIGVFTFVKDLAGCCQYSSPITNGAADSNIRIGTLSGHDQNTPRRSKIQKLNAMRQHIRVLQCMAFRLSG